MSPADVIVLAVVAALLFFGIRSLLRDNKNGCSDCGGSCSAHKNGGTCSSAERMIAHANKVFEQHK